MRNVVQAVKVTGKPWLLGDFCKRPIYANMGQCRTVSGLCLILLGKAD